MRLAKYLAQAGVASRRASEELIRQGRVTIDGVTVDDPARDVSEPGTVAVDGHRVSPDSERVVYMVNKPAGVVSTVRDTHRRPTVVSLVPPGRRLYPVGRLDLDTTGLILLTNDGGLAHRLTHPRFGVPKTYRAVLTRPPIGASALRALREGVELEDGPSAPARVRRIGPGTIEITIREGRNRQVRRMCQAVGHPVRSLARVGFGPLALGTLRPGQYRQLGQREVAALARAGSGAHSRSSASPASR